MQELVVCLSSLRSELLNSQGFVLMSSETLKRAEDIFELMQQRKLSAEDGKTLLQRLQSLIEVQGTIPTADTEQAPRETTGLHANANLARSSLIGQVEEEEEEEYSDCNDLGEERRFGRNSPVQFADLRREIDLYRSSRKDTLQTERDLHKEMTDIRQILSQQTGLLQDLLYRLTQSPDRMTAHPVQQEVRALNSQSRDSVGVQTITDATYAVRNDSGKADLNELARENPHPNDMKIALDEASGNFTVEVEMESVSAVIRSYCKQFNADEAIANLRSSSSWGPTSKYFNLSDEEIKAQW